MRATAGFLAALLLWSGVACAAPAYVTGWNHGNGASSANTAVVTVTGAATGNTLVVFVGMHSATSGESVTSVVDNASPANTYTAADNHAVGTQTTTGYGCVNADQYCVATFYSCNITHAPTTVTANLPVTASFHSIFVDEISGTAAACLDVHQETAQSTAPGTGANAVISGNITTTVNGDFIEGGTVNVTSNGSIAHGTSPLAYVQQQYVTNDTMTEGVVQASLGLLTNGATFTAGNASDQYITAVLALKPTVVAAATPGVRFLPAFPFGG